MDILYLDNKTSLGGNNIVNSNYIYSPFVMTSPLRIVAYEGTSSELGSFVTGRDTLVGRLVLTTDGSVKVLFTSLALPSP